MLDEPLQQQLRPLRTGEAVPDSLGNQVTHAVGAVVEDLQMNRHAQRFELSLDGAR